VTYSIRTPDATWLVHRPDAELEVTWYDGSGPLLLLVHGYPDDHRVMSPLVEALAGRARCAVYDTRGAARTAVRGRGRRQFTLDALAGDLMAVVASLPGDDPVHLVGHDWGSVQSWAAVGQDEASHRLASFVSISGPGLDHLRVSAARAAVRPSRWLPVARQLMLSWYALAYSIRPLRPLAVRLFLALAATELEPAKVPRPERLANARRGAALYAANVVPRMLRGPAPASRVPLGIVVPSDDRFLAPIAHQAMIDTHPDAQVFTVDGGHWWIHDSPHEAASIVLTVIADTTA
jgi:pimeloyl-ACP methyl ester carboxylesterase